MYLWILPSQSIKRTVEEKLEETFNIFYKELKIGNKELNQTSMFYPDHMPRKAGQVYWVMAQRHQLERFMEVRRLDNKKDLWFLVHNYCFLHSLTNLTSISSTLFAFLCLQVLQKAHLILDSQTCKELLTTCGQTMQILDEIVRKNFSEWTQKLDVQYLKRLEQPLMVRCKDKKLDINFDKWVKQHEHTWLKHKRYKAYMLNSV